MNKTEFRYNKKRKHYSYIFKSKGDYRKNLLLSTKSTRKVKRNGNNAKLKNVELYQHPNPNSNKKVYIMTRIYNDNKNNFDYELKNWKFHPYDRLKVKKIKNKKWH